VVLELSAEPCTFGGPLADSRVGAGGSCAHEIRRLFRGRHPGHTKVCASRWSPALAHLFNEKSVILSGDTVCSLVGIRCGLEEIERMDYCSPTDDVAECNIALLKRGSFSWSPYRSKFPILRVILNGTDVSYWFQSCFPVSDALFHQIRIQVSYSACQV
jgi:hypothetical protein